MSTRASRAVGVARRLRPVVTTRREVAIRRAACSLIPVGHQSSIAHVYHCAPWKAGSQWTRAVLYDPRVYRHSGLVPSSIVATHSELRRLTPRPERSVTASIYADPERLATLDSDWVERDDVRVLAVVRHPAALLRSWYLANLRTHDPNPDVLARREVLTPLSEEDGLLASLEMGWDLMVKIMFGWLRLAETDNRIRVVRFEDLSGTSGTDPVAEWQQIWAHCDVGLSAEASRRVLDTYSPAGMKSGTRSSKYERSGNQVEHLPPRVWERMHATLDEPGKLPYDLGG